MRLAVKNLIGYAALALASQAEARQDRGTTATGVPPYSHVVVIVEENKDFSQIINPAVAPNIARLAGEYGSADDFFGEVHPSEANYLALLGGDTFGIYDDDAFIARPGRPPRIATVRASPAMSPTRSTGGIWAISSARRG